MVPEPRIVVTQFPLAFGNVVGNLLDMNAF